MKKGMITGILGVALLAGWPLMAAEDHSMHMTNEYCTKHCTAEQLRKEVKSLEKSIEADKASLKSRGGAEPLATLRSRTEQVKKHLAQHEKELNDLKVELDKAEAELNQMGNK